MNDEKKPQEKDTAISPQSGAGESLPSKPTGGSQVAHGQSPIHHGNIPTGVSAGGTRPLRNEKLSDVSWEFAPAVHEKVAYRVVAIVDDMLSKRGTPLKDWERERLARSVLFDLQWGFREFRNFIHEIAVRSGVIRNEQADEESAKTKHE